MQVTSLALCKVNKSEMFLRRLSQHFRHERTNELFWKMHDVPHEALQILKACFLTKLSCLSSLISPGCMKAIKLQGQRETQWPGGQDRELTVQAGNTLHAALSDLSILELLQVSTSVCPDLHASLM